MNFSSQSPWRTAIIPIAKKLVLLSGAVFVLVLTSCNDQSPLETQVVITNGHIYSLAWTDPDSDGTPSTNAPFENNIWYPDAEAIYISGDKILYVGTNEAALAQAHSSAKIIDVSGAVVIPGVRNAGENGRDLLDSLFIAMTGSEKMGSDSTNNGISDGSHIRKIQMTPEEALRTFTVWSVRETGSGASTGAIKSGNRADLTVLSVDPLNVVMPSESGIGIPVTELLDGKVDLIMLGGVIVYRRMAEKR